MLLGNGKGTPKAPQLRYDEELFCFKGCQRGSAKKPQAFPRDNDDDDFCGAREWPLPSPPAPPSPALFCSVVKVVFSDFFLLKISKVKKI